MARGLRYTLGFTDREGAAVEIQIDEEGWEGEAVELTPGASPLTLQEDDTEGLDTPSRAWTGRLTVVAEEGVDLSGLYAPEVTSSRVTVRRGGQTVWQGYLSPAVVRQDWVAGGEVTVSVQSPLAAMEGLTLDAAGGFGYVTLGELLQEVARLTGDWQMVAFPDDLSVALPEVAADSRTDSWMDVKVSRYAFFEKNYDEGDFDESEVARVTYTGATGREVVEELCRLLGWTASERAGVLWLTAESSPGYQMVSVGQLDAPGRTLTPTVVAELALDDLIAAGTDHTVSQLRGYRRVRVTFTPDVPDTLTPGDDVHNWAPLSEFQFEEDQLFRRRDNLEEEAGWYVKPTSRDLFAGGTAADAAGGVNYYVAPFARKAVDGKSETYLYAANHLTGYDRDEGWQLSRYAGEEGEEPFAENIWSFVTSGAYNRSSFMGARRAWLRWRFAMLDSERGVEWAYAYDFGERTRADGYLCYVAADKSHKVEGAGGQALVRLLSPESYVIDGCALVLSASFSGFYGLEDRAALGGDIPYKGKVGPWAVTKHDAIKAWPMRLRVGSKFWNGEFWQDAACDFTVNLTGAAENDRAEIEPTGRQEDADKYDNEDGYLVLLKDSRGEPLTLSGEVELTLYVPDQATVADSSPSATPMVWFNPVFIRDVSITVLLPRDHEAAYDTGDGERARHYVAATGYRSAEDLRDVMLEFGSWDGDGCASNVLVTGDHQPFTAFASKRQGGMVARPERLVLSVLRRLYGRARRQLCVEVDAARLSPSATVTDGRTRYALSGVEWDVRESTCKYTLEEYVPYDEWKG